MRRNTDERPVCIAASGEGEVIGGGVHGGGNVDVGKSFTFVFEDEDWVIKVLVGGLVNLVPIVNLAVAGYAVRTLRNVARREPRPLPDWRDLGDFFVEGAAVFVASLVYFSPLIVLALLAAILGAVFVGQGNGLVVGGLGLLAFVAAVYGLLVALWFPAATAIYAACGDFAVFFRLGEIWELIIRDLGGYVAALVASLAAFIAAGVIGGLLFGVGVAFAGFIAALVSAHLFGQLLVESGQSVL